MHLESIFVVDLGRPLWTMTHSHYVIMGGYALDDSDTNPSFIGDDLPRPTLTPEALCQLAKWDLNLIPNIRGINT